MKRRLGCLPVLAAGLLLAALAATAEAAPPDAKERALARSHAAAVSALDRAQALRQGRGVVNGRELTPALAELSARYEALDPRERREADRLLARPTDGAGDPLGDGYTVAEHAPFCTADFCLHWVTTTGDAPALTDGDGDDVPDYVESMAAEFAFTRARENTDFGWRLPVSDGARGGGAGKLDIYLVDLAGTGILGYAATDPGQADPHQKFAYMVMDDDYADQPDPDAVMQVTAAHEYNHVLQFAYDAAQDTWMFEATAVWMEDRVHDDVDHYLGFIPGWASLDEVPLAKTNKDKHYGSGVWNMWLDGLYGPDLIRDAWAGSAGAAPQSFAPGAYDSALVGDGHEGFPASFGRFSAAVAEWRTGAQFPEGAAYTDVQRRGNLQVAGAAVKPLLDHTSFALYTVPQPAGGWPAVLRLDGELPAGVTGAIALVGRTGADPLAGTVSTVLQQLPAGGGGSIQLENPAAFGRVTAVLVNADTDTTGFTGGDWVFADDAQPFAAAAAASASTASAPANTSLPVISGTPRDGSTLSATTGGWSGSAPMGYARQWRRCDSAGDNCADSAGATGAGYTATEQDVGQRLRVRVTASNAVSSAAADSAPTIAIVALAPASLTPPEIDDTTPVVGQTINATDGTWSGSAPLTIAHQWQRCVTAGGSCTDIAGATASAYTVADADADRFLRVRATASNSGGSASRNSASTQKVTAPAPAAPENTVLPTVSGTARDGQTLTATDGTWTGSPSLTREWRRCDGAACAGTGVTSSQYVLGPADVGRQMRVRVTATNGGGTANADSAPTATVEALAPAPVSAPVLSGTATDGQTLTTTNGTWTGTDPDFTYEWLRCGDDTVPSCGPIGGATNASYALTASDVGKRVRARVRAANGAGDASALSEPTAVVAGVAPANAVAPSITGTAAVGSELTSLMGSWTGTTPITITRQWQRCTSGGLTCADIPGQVGEKYAPTLADVLAQLRVVVKATNVAGTASAASALAGPVPQPSTGGGGGSGGGGSGGSGGGGAPAGPPTPPAVVALAVTVKAPAKAKLASALAGKLVVPVDCSAACTVTARVELAKKAAKKLGVPAVLARGSGRLAAAGRANVKLAFASKARKKLRKARTVSATLVVEARDAAGALAAQRRGRLTLGR